MKTLSTFLLVALLMLLPAKGIRSTASGQGWQWGRSAAGVGIDSWPVATDASGNVFGAGYMYSGGTANFGGGITIAGIGGGEQAVWVKYNSAGTALWAGAVTGSDAYIMNIATDPSGNLLVFGSFSTASITIGSFVLTNPHGSGYQQYYLAKINPAGTVLWAVNDGNIGTSYRSALSALVMSVGSVATDPAGNIYIASSFNKATMTIGSTTLTNAVSSGVSQDVFVAKYTPGGVPVWATSIGGSGDDCGFGITVASTGNVYVSGDYTSTSMAVGPSLLTNTTGRVYAYIAKFSPAGVPLWGQGEGGTEGAFAVGVTHDNYGNVYMTGGFINNTLMFGDTAVSKPLPFPTDSVSAISCFLVQYSSANEVTWHKVISGLPNSRGSATSTWGFAIAMASCGQVWVSGNFSDSISVDTAKIYKPVGGYTGDPVFIAGYNLTGGVIGYSALGSGGDDQNGIACDPAGNVYMCSDYFTTPYFLAGPDTLRGSGGENFYVAKYANTLAIVDTIHKSKDTTACLYSGITLHGEAGYTNYFWNDSTTDSTHHFDSAGVYFVYNIRCGDTVVVDTFHFILTMPDSGFIRHDSAVCFLADSATIYGPTGYDSYNWNTGSVATAITVHSVGSYVLAAGTFATCSVLIDTFHFTELYDSTHGRRPDTAVCASVGTITLSGPPGYSGYSWNTGASTRTIAVSASGYFNVASTINCTLRLDSTHVRFMPVPLVNLGNDTAFCLGQSITLSSPQPAGFSYSWSTGSTAPSIIAGGSVAGATIYSLVVTDTDACTTTATITVTVSPLPVVDLGPDTAICTGSIPILHSFVTYPAWATYIWNTGSTASSIPASTIGSYWLQVTVVGCSGADTIQIKNLFDTLHFPQTDTALCKGQQLQVTVSGTPGMAYQWTPTAGISSSTTGSTMILADTSATYTLTASLSTCADIVRSFHLDIQPYPQVVLEEGNRFVCRYDTLHLIASVTPSWYSSYIYRWSPGADLNDSTSPYPVFTAGDSEQIVLTVTTPHGCAGQDSIWIYTHPSGFASLDTTIRVCPHDSARLMPVSSDAGTTYRWHPTLYLSDSTAASPWVYAITSQAYVGIAYSQYNCRDTVHAYVVVTPNAEILIPDSATIYPGESYQIPTQTNCTSFMWFPPSGLSSASIASPLATPGISTKYIVTASNEYGCKVTDSITITVSTETLLDIPNAFTPGNGPNGTFKVLKLGTASLTYFRVFNRWGNKVYDGNSIDAGWDGTYKGVPQPYDVYVYEIEAITSTGRTFTKTGNVTLIR